MWEFYLTCAEMVFRRGSGMVFQMQLTRQRDAVPGTRDYVYETPLSPALFLPSDSAAA